MDKKIKQVFRNYVKRKKTKISKIDAERANAETQVLNRLRKKFSERFETSQSLASNIDNYIEFFNDDSLFQRLMAQREMLGEYFATMLACEDELSALNELLQDVNLVSKPKDPIDFVKEKSLGFSATVAYEKIFSYDFFKKFMQPLMPNVAFGKAEENLYICKQPNVDNLFQEYYSSKIDV